MKHGILYLVAFRMCLWNSIASCIAFGSKCSGCCWLYWIIRKMFIISRALCQLGMHDRFNWQVEHLKIILVFESVVDTQVLAFGLVRLQQCYSCVERLSWLYIYTTCMRISKQPWTVNTHVDKYSRFLTIYFDSVLKASTSLLKLHWPFFLIFWRT